MRSVFFTLFFVLGVACIEAPPEASKNNQTTNNSTTNNTDPTPRFRPFNVSDDLELLFLFDEAPIEKSMKNLAPLNAGFDLTWSADSVTLTNDEIDLGQNSAEVAFADDIIAAIQDKSQISIELWWRHYWSQSGDIVGIGDKLRILADSANNVHNMRIVLNGTTHELGVVDLDPLSHLVFTMNDSVATLYVDGLVVWAHRVSDPFEPLTGAGQIVFGQATGAYLAFSKIAVYSRTLTPGEVAMHAYLGPVSSLAPTRPDIFAEHYRKTIYQDNLRKEFQAVTIAPNSEADGLHFGPINDSEVGLPIWRVETSKDHLPPLADDLHGFAKLEITTLNSTADTPFNLSVYGLRRPWVAQDVSWTNASDEVPWTEPGALDPEDRGGTPLYTVPLQYPDNYNHTERVFVKLDDVVSRWFSNRNNGLIFDTEMLALGTFENSGLLSPGLVVFGAAPPLEPLPSFGYSILEDESGGCRVIAADSLKPGYKFEVWMNNEFAGLSSGNRIDVVDCDPTTIEVSTIDMFGNRVFHTM